jgi:hypothetical protein
MRPLLHAAWMTLAAGAMFRLTFTNTQNGSWGIISGGNIPSEEPLDLGSRSSRQFLCLQPGPLPG